MRTDEGCVVHGHSFTDDDWLGYRGSLALYGLAAIVGVHRIPGCGGYILAVSRGIGKNIE